MTSNNGSNGSNGKGIAQPRAEWIAARRAEAQRLGDTNMSQMHWAKKASSPTR